MGANQCCSKHKDVGYENPEDSGKLNLVAPQKKQLMSKQGSDMHNTISSIDGNTLLEVRRLPSKHESQFTFMDTGDEGKLQQVSEAKGSVLESEITEFRVTPLKELDFNTPARKEKVNESEEQDQSFNFESSKDVEQAEDLNLSKSQGKQDKESDLKAKATPEKENENLTSKSPDNSIKFESDSKQEENAEQKRINLMEKLDARRLEIQCVTTESLGISDLHKHGPTCIEVEEVDDMNPDKVYRQTDFGMMKDKFGSAAIIIQEENSEQQEDSSRTENEDKSNSGKIKIEKLQLEVSIDESPTPKQKLEENYENLYTPRSANVAFSTAIEIDNEDIQQKICTFINSESMQSTPDRSSCQQSVDNTVSDFTTNKNYDDDLNQFEWDGPTDSDEEIPEMVELKNQSEIDMDIRFSKRGIIEFIDNVLEEDCIQNDPEWDQKMKTPVLNYFIRKGSSRNKKQPYLRSEIYFAKPFKMDKLIKTIFNGEHQTKWDKNFKLSQRIQIVDGKNSFYQQYTLNNQILIYDPRDFYEKGISFVSDGVFYKYHSPLNNDLRPLKRAIINKKTVRAETLICVTKIFRNKDNQKVTMISNNQIDFKMNIPDSVVNVFAPKAAKKWINDIQKYYKKNHQNIQ